MSTNEHTTISALSALAEHLERAGVPRVELVVCGGTALQLLGLISRTTRDVDVLALARTDQSGSVVELLSAEELPPPLMQAASIVARDFGLPENWLNSGPTGLMAQRLPEGLVDRLQSRRFGERLMVHLVDRPDQICLKLYAVVNDGDPRHLADFQAMRPSHAEIMVAVRWCLTQDASEQFPAWVRSCLEKIGYPDAAGSI